MQQRKSKATESNPWALIDAELRKPQHKTPEGEGWRTVEEIRKEWQCGISKAFILIRRLRAEGRLEMFRGSKDGKGKRPAPEVWYRPVSAQVQTRKVIAASN